MSEKRLKMLDDSSSSDDEEVDTSVGDLSSKTSKSLKKRVGDSTRKQLLDSDSGSDDSVSEHKKPDSVVKKIDSKKVKSCGKSSAKRCRETNEGGVSASTEVKKVKKEEEKKTYFQRVWSEKDEIKVLKGLIDYKNNTGLNPDADTNGVYELVKKSVSFDVSKIQFKEKLRNLKKKYNNKIGKANKKGEEPTFVKPHDHKAFKLSKLLWGAGANGEKIRNDCEDEVMKKGQVSLVVAAEVDSFRMASLVKFISHFGMDELVVQQGLNWLAPEDKRSLEEQWKAFQVQELDYNSKKNRFWQVAVTMTQNAIRSNL